jgi:UDP-glucose 4-epimerase
VRDYVHVTDIARAHVAAARRLDAGEPLEAAYNLGSGSGSSVAEIMAAVARVTGIPFEPEVGPRRAGDPPRIVANGDLAARDLDWRMRHTLDEMVASAWAARQAAPTP